MSSITLSFSHSYYIIGLAPYDYCLWRTSTQRSSFVFCAHLAICFLPFCTQKNNTASKFHLLVFLLLLLLHYLTVHCFCPLNFMTVHAYAWLCVRLPVRSPVHLAVFGSNHTYAGWLYLLHVIIQKTVQRHFLFHFTIVFLLQHYDLFAFPLLQLVIFSPLLLLLVLALFNSIYLSICCHQLLMFIQYEECEVITAILEVRMSYSLLWPSLLLRAEST